jgi:hypothetical protein
MASKTTRLKIYDGRGLHRIVSEAAAGVAHATIAAGLNRDGIPVPRWDGDARIGTPPANMKDGYNLITKANPGVWDAAAIALVLAAPEAVATNNYAVARATLSGDSDLQTTLTIS